MKTGNGRRTFVIKALLGKIALAITKFGFTQPAKLQESDPQAVAHHYKDDAKRVDKSKYPKYEPGQVCLNVSYTRGTSRLPHRAQSSETSWSLPRDGAAPGSKRPALKGVA